MIQVEGKFARVHNGLPYAARVTVTVEEPSAQPDILFSCSGKGWIRQGYLEEVPAVGYDSWKAGARAGIEYALSKAGVGTARVEVVKIVGMITDTNPSVVGAAAAIAIWKALEFEPPEEVISSMEAVVFGNWQRSHDEVPQFP
jgi:hypothetical protein